MTAWLRLVATAIGGYLLIALSQTLVLEGMLRGQVHPEAPAGVLLAALAGTFASGLIGGYVTAWLGGIRPWAAVGGVLAVLGLDTLWVIVRNTQGDPVWYLLGGALTLMAATAAGAWIRTRFAPRKAQSQESTNSAQPSGPLDSGETHSP